MSEQDSYEHAWRELAKASEAIWDARCTLSLLLQEGEPVKSAYDKAVRASYAVDRAWHGAPARSKPKAAPHA